MLVLDVPAYIITSIMFTVAGWMYGGDNVDLNRVEFLKESLLKHFDIKIWMLVPAIIVIVLLAMKKPSMPTIAMGAFTWRNLGNCFPRNALWRRNWNSI